MEDSQSAEFYPARKLRTQSPGIQKHRGRQPFQTQEPPTQPADRVIVPGRRMSLVGPLPCGCLGRSRCLHKKLVIICFCSVNYSWLRLVSTAVPSPSYNLFAASFALVCVCVRDHLFLLCTAPLDSSIREHCRVYLFLGIFAFGNVIQKAT